jgi:hypothetical protein
MHRGAETYKEFSHAVGVSQLAQMICQGIRRPGRREAEIAKNYLGAVVAGEARDVPAWVAG